MSEQQLRQIKRIDYSNSGSRLCTLDSYSLARQPTRDTDDSSSDEVLSIQSENDTSTIVQRGRSSESVTDLSQEFSRLTMSGMDTKKLLAAHESARDDVNDFIDEHPIRDLITIDDVNQFLLALV